MKIHAISYIIDLIKHSRIENRIITVELLDTFTGAESGKIRSGQTAYWWANSADFERQVFFNFEKRIVNTSQKNRIIARSRDVDLSFLNYGYSKNLLSSHIKWLQFSEK
jgi:hypothetical protein